MNSSVWAELAVRKKSGFEFFCATFEGVFFNYLRAKKFDLFFFLKTLYILHCRKYSHFFWWFWWFCLLLNIWDSSFTYLFAAEPLNFLYCWTFEIICCCWTFGFSLLLNLWEYALDYVSVYCWTFGFYLLLNLWNYLFASEPLDFLYCWTFGFFLLLNIWDYAQRYTYRVLQTIQMKLILLCVWAERVVLGSAKTALNFK